MTDRCVGIDLGGTFIKFVATDRQGGASEIFELPTPTDRGPEGLVEQMVRGARTLIDQSTEAGDRVIGVGIGSPGPLDLAAGVVIATPNIGGMTNVPLRDMVSEPLGLPVVLENDANAAAYGEYISGAGKDADDLVVLTLGTGVGGGIVIGGEVLHGAHEIGAELGHIILVPDGAPCGCGQRGCIEQYCSAKFMADRTMARIAAEKPQTALNAIMESKGSIDAKDINDARADGDSFAAEAWDQTARYLALGCVSLTRIFDPDKIVLTGGMAKAGADLIEPVRAHFIDLHWDMTEIKTEVDIATLGSDAGSIGAAGVAWRRFGS
ncbi:MAG: ROK family glucokinase [Phycisphaerae bacterium]|jgi:glucokinase|nr:ROK family glucokinase [Phycisphaerae bacterium]